MDQFLPQILQKEPTLLTPWLGLLPSWPMTEYISVPVFGNLLQ